MGYVPRSPDGLDQWPLSLLSYLLSVLNRQASLPVTGRSLMKSNAR
jgi:hypothetical protein